jgi:serine/threonine-protein kinase
VAARPHTLTYRTGRLLRRHRWIAPGAAVGLIFLTFYAVSSVRHTAAIEEQRNAAREEAERASEVQRLLVDLFRSPDPLAFADPERGRAITVVEALDLGAERVLNGLDDRPRIQASLLGALADVFTSLAAHDKAVPLAERALVLHEQADGVASAEYRAALARLAAAHLADVDSAHTLLRRRVDLAVAAGGSLNAEVAEARAALATHLRYSMRRPIDAAAEYGRALAIADSTAVPAATLADVHRGLADIHHDLGQSAEAEPHARRAVELHRAVHGEDAPNTAMAREVLARVLAALGRSDEAQTEFERAIAVLERTFGSDHGITLNALNNLAVFRRGVGDLAGAEQALRGLLEPQARARGAASREVGDTYQNLGSVIAEQGRIDEAAGMHARAAAIYEATLDPGNYLLAFPHLSLAGLELRRNDFAAAEIHARRALATLELTLPADHFATAVARCRLGRALAGQSRRVEAATLIRAAVENLPPETPVPAYREECVDALATVEPAAG